MMSGYKYLLIAALFGFSSGYLKYPVKEDGCGWYKKHMNEFISCQNDQYDYVNYATTYCNAFSFFVSSQRLPPQLINFIDDGRLCLQEKLHDYLQYDPYASCEDVESFAFESHSGCYTQAGFCELSFWEQSKIGNVVKGSAFKRKNGRGLRTWSSAWNLVTNCYLG